MHWTSLLSLRELTYGKCSCCSNCWHRELESSAKDNHSTVFEVVCAWLAFPTAWHFSRQGFWLQITWMLNMANLRTDFHWCPEDIFLWAGHDWFLQSNQLRETVLSGHFLKSRKTHQCYSVTGKTVNTWNISEMLIVLWPITAEIRTCEQATKPQTS